MKAKVIFLLVLNSFLYLNSFAQESFFCSYTNQRQLKRSSVLFSSFDVVFQRLSLKIDPAVYFLQGKVDVYYKAKNNLDAISLDLSDSLRVDSVKQRDVLLSFLHKNDTLHIAVAHLSIDNLDSVSIFYQGKPTKKNEAFIKSIQDEDSNIPVIANLSEPYGASDWWPCKNTLTDKIDSIDLFLSVPKGNIVVSNGLLKNVKTEADILVYHWKHSYPITPYLVSIAVSDYKEYTYYIHFSNGDSLLFTNYLYQKDFEKNKLKINQTDKFIRFYDSLFVPYPFMREKYGHVQFPVGGGMEHQTISSMGYFDYEIISHELAHQWFGDDITCASWLDIWLNEGFATYCTGLCYEFLDTEWWPKWKDLTVERITKDVSGAVFPKDTISVRNLFDSRLTYRKAAYVLHMIRWTIGDAAFFQAIRNYLSNSELEYNFAKTKDFISFFEAEADTSLSTFMDDWFYGEGYPIYHIEWNQDSENELNMKISQESSMNDGHFFAMYLPLCVIGDTDSLDLRLKNTYSGELYAEKVNFKIRKIIFDPEKHLISKNTEINLLLKDDCIVYPNPMLDVLHVKAKEKIIALEVFKEDGKQYLYLSPNNEQQEIETNSWSRGVYIIKIKTASFTKVYKLIK